TNDPTSYRRCHKVVEIVVFVANTRVHTRSLPSTPHDCGVSATVKRKTSALKDDEPLLGHLADRVRGAFLRVARPFDPAVRHLVSRGGSGPLTRAGRQPRAPRRRQGGSRAPPRRSPPVGRSRWRSHARTRPRASRPR